MYHFTTCDDEESFHAVHEGVLILPERGPLWGDVRVPVLSTPPNKVNTGVFVGASCCCPWCPRLPDPTAGLRSGVRVCWAGLRWRKWPLSDPVPMVPSRLMEREPSSLGLLLPAPMCRPGMRGGDECNTLTLCCHHTEWSSPNPFNLTSIVDNRAVYWQKSFNTWCKCDDMIHKPIYFTIFLNDDFRIILILIHFLQK